MNKKVHRLTRRGPDVVMLELTAVLSELGTHEFNALCDIVQANLRARNAAGSDREMLRLRTYEKLQSLVTKGIVTKTGKEYCAKASALEEYRKTLEVQAAPAAAA